MPQTKSAKKALRRDRRREKVNKPIRQETKKAVSQARKKPDLKSLTEATCLLDRAARKGIIHKNKAARLKSRLSKLLKKQAEEKKTIQTKKSTKKSKSRH